MEHALLDLWSERWLKMIIGKEAILAKIRVEDFWFNISMNPNLTMNTIKKHPDFSWNWTAISSNPSITLDIIDDNPDFPWDFDEVSYNPNITLDYVLNHPDKPWNWCGISLAKNITMEMIKNNPDMPWEYCFISQNPNFTLDMVYENPNADWCWEDISEHPDFTIQMYHDFPDEPYCLRSICKHKNITLKIIMETPKIEWNWTFIGENPNITLQTFDDETLHLLHQDGLLRLPHDTKIGFCSNPNLTLELAQKHNWFALDWYYASFNPNLTVDFVAKHLDKDWYFIGVHQIIKVNFDDFARFPDFPWRWDILAKQEFKKDKQIFMENGYARILLLAIHDHYVENKCQETSVEYAFADSYVMKYLIEK
jgi:hypothetical protein